MTCFIIIFLLLASVYPLSYAGYVWRKRNFFGALGMLLLTLASVAFPVYLLYSR